MVGSIHCSIALIHLMCLSPCSTLFLRRRSHVQSRSDVFLVYQTHLGDVLVPCKQDYIPDVLCHECDQFCVFPFRRGQNSFAIRNLTILICRLDVEVCTMLVQMSTTAYSCSVFAAAPCFRTQCLPWKSCRWCPGLVLFAIPDYLALSDAHE